MFFYNNQLPPGPPPSYIPKKSKGPELKAIDPGAIRFCRYKFTYIWLENGRSFWVWLIFVGRNSIAGYKWIRGRWRFWGTDIRNIDSFYC
ncbi:hypothetical protein [Tepidibacter thalassicus]|uniref:Transporter n=1 Tax=Tepidibacter thalassicus DSM 15285 TaxID=1123350 RepID=A0A1M5NX19_9FIRM|nr:hypothetical protein [Tepidibacter thalassicus]SHG94071.1 hypothetical protein SAMN02744040_00267 [Tepidibacter thalassicus DSM 15285]